jgi:hypothetical protein
MCKDEVVSAIMAAKKAGSFKLKFIFAVGSEVSRVRSFVTMLNGDCITVDDDTLMRLRVVAITMKWSDDTDRVVIMNICDNFDENEFVAKLAHAIEYIEAMPVTSLNRDQKIREGTMDVQKAIRNIKADVNASRDIRIVIPKATQVEVAMIMDMLRYRQISFANPNEQTVFEEAARNNSWSLGGRLSANIRIEAGLNEHVASAIMHEAHVRVRTAKIMR